MNASFMRTNDAVTRTNPSFTSAIDAFTSVWQLTRPQSSSPFTRTNASFTSVKQLTCYQPFIAARLR
jgi:hypothetical protein